MGCMRLDSRARVDLYDTEEPVRDQSRPIVVALSGGVDSATAAAMLVADGHRVVGITMRLYDARGTRASIGGRCCGPRDIEDARKVCHHLDIPFYVVDFEAEFVRDVIDDFVDSYLAGETPNPCVKCNQHIKFTPLIERARALGADKVATGHYARIERGDDGRMRLRRGVDASKDQSYFLFSMPQGELDSVLFPLGGMDKAEVREKAAELGLPNAAKPESQEICFVPDGDYAGFVERRALTRNLRVPGAGDIVDRQGQVLGRHEGVHRFTVGQRRGLGAVGQGKPAYVVDIDREREQVIVGERGSARRQALTLRDTRWLAPVPGEPMRALVQVRHRARPVPAEVAPLDASGERVRVSFLGDPVVAAPGQAAVMYCEDTVLGGGWIAR